MHIKLTNHIFGDLELPSEQVIGVYGPRCINGEGVSDEEIASALENPINTSPLSTLAAGCGKVLIVTDDNTRETPLHRLLPPILKQLESAGVPTSGIVILIGLGTHRAMTSAEIHAKFGPKIAGSYSIVNHEWDNPDVLVSLGKSSLGFEISINRLIQMADLIISIGSIVPHATVGFSGGGKTIMPGICGSETISATHWAALNYSIAELLGVQQNPIRFAINDICHRIKLGMIVNTVLFGEGNIYGIVAGHYATAFSKGVGLSKEVYAVKVSEPADIVIAEAYPTDVDLRQAIKAICSADLVCRDGGVIILAAECAEGIAPQFPSFAKYGFREPEKLYHDVEEGLFREKLMAYTLVAIGRIISDKKQAILVSPHIDSIEAEQMGFYFSPDLPSAANKAFEMTQKNADVIVLLQAGEVLPLFPESTAKNS